jgi:serine/threonine-protein kinase
MTAGAHLSDALADRYRIERELGAGGMATVYLAEDLKHDRKVAIKVLKPELAAVLGAERFVQEIKTTAALSHPHILPLFDSGEAGGFLYYVMPFIEGETIREKLNRETQFGIDEAVRIASEVADALDYAHRHGVIHRDIKPENILLHDGRPMVMDFGIALAVSAAAGGRMTETGLSLGTPHYMSPEQATADKAITARSDIYSLASVLYEMLTGEPPHMGTSAQQIIMKIIAEPVKPATELRKSVPPNVTAALSRALEKLPADRFDSAKAFGDALQTATFRTGSETGQRAAATPLTGSRLTTILAGTTLLALVLAAWGWLRPASAPQGQVARFNVVLDSADFISSQDAPAISPDGRRIAYSAPTGGLYVRDLGSLRATRIPDYENVWAPFFSPDNASLGFATGFPGDLIVMGLSGGAPRTIVSGTASGYGAAWSEDGWIYYTQHGGSLQRVRSNGGEPELVATPDSARDELFIRWPVVLPGERTLAVTLWRRRGPPDIAVMDVGNGEMRVVRRGVRAYYVPTGHLIIVQGDGTVVAVRFDPGRGTTIGEPVRVLDNLHVIYGGTVQLSISPGGTMVYSPYGGVNRLMHVRRDGQAAIVSPEGTGAFGGIALSPDGRNLALDQVVDGRGEIWVRSLENGSFARVASGGTLTFRPFWFPDGRSIGFLSDMSGAGQPYRVAAVGGPVERLVDIPQAVDEGAWSRDGRWLVLRTGSGGGRDLTVMEIGVDSIPRSLIATEYDEYSPAISPDGRWLAYGSNLSGRDEIYVSPFPDVDGGRWPVSTAGGIEPTWSNSGRELFFRDAAGMLVSVRIDPAPPFRIVSRQPLFSAAHYRSDSRNRGFAVSPDDQSFLFVDTQAGPVNELVIVLKWLDELRRIMSGR